ncbi:hypothetical protein PIB30_047395 [Stylosanthes scabra]|uniref:Uncharacterized protein n=1 Tax=Stylosanthes scabra TaxID=79078 RepID=A0ABU6QGZ6_9FABA|nr:hypothetical protein [Stylosanthes scabra]
MEDLSMFQRPRTVALEDENPGTYGTALIYPLNRLVSVASWVTRLLILGLASSVDTRVSPERILFISLVNHHSLTLTIATLVFLTTKIVSCVNSLGDDPSPVLGNPGLILLRRLGRSARQLYKFLGLGPLKKTEEIFSNADAGVVSIVGIAENVKVKIGGLIIPADFHVIKPGKKDNGGTPQVLLGRPFLKSGGYKLNYHDEIFTFEVANTIEIFHLDNCSVPEKKGLRQLKTDKKKKKEKRMAKKRRKRKEKEADKKNQEFKIPTTKSKKDKKKKKKKKALSTLEKRKGIRKTEGSNPKKKKTEGGKIRRN